MNNTTNATDAGHGLKTQNIFLLDVILGVICFVFISVGVPGNLVVIRHFSRQRKDLPTVLYLLISSNDLVITSTVLPSALSFVDHRNPHLFGVKVFCQGWGLVWTILPFISVFLVSVLSITRTIMLTRPLVVISRRVVLGMVGLYYVYIVFRVLVPWLLGEIHFIYSRADVYCWDGGTHSGSRWYFYYDIATGALQLAAPIVPIFLSCLISTVTLLRSQRRDKAFGFSGTARRPKLFATVTIILVTVVYILFNIPIFGAWCKYLADELTVDPADQFAFWYLWGVTYVLCTAGNAAVNPLLLYWRNRNFRNSVRISEVSQGQTAAREGGVLLPCRNPRTSTV